jgi:hypothetical protein
MVIPFDQYWEDALAVLFPKADLAPHPLGVVRFGREKHDDPHRPADRFFDLAFPGRGAGRQVSTSTQMFKPRSRSSRTIRLCLTVSSRL